MKLSLILMTKKRFKIDYFQFIEQKKLFNRSIFTIIVLLKSSLQFMPRLFFFVLFSRCIDIPNLLCLVWQISKNVSWKYSYDSYFKRAQMRRTNNNCQREEHPQ